MDEKWIFIKTSTSKKVATVERKKIKNYFGGYQFERNIWMSRFGVKKLKMKLKNFIFLKLNCFTINLSTKYVRFV